MMVAVTGGCYWWLLIVADDACYGWLLVVADVECYGCHWGSFMIFVSHCR